MSTNYNRLLEDSRSNKILIFYKENALYSNLIKVGYQPTETILIRDVCNNYVASIDTNDKVFIACYTNEGNVALISGNDLHWELEDTISMPKEIDIILLELFIIKGVIHVIYATCLPIKNYYNIYHIYFINNTWKKENIAEIHSSALLESYSCSLSSDGVIHFVSIYNDRKAYFIKYSSFNSSMLKWVSSIVSNLNNNHIHLNLLNDGKNLHLICYSLEEKIFIYYYFINKGINCDSFEFEFITKFRLQDVNFQPVFYILNNSIFMAFIAGENYYEYILNDKIKEWETYFKLPLNNKINKIRLVVYTNSFLDRGYFCFFDESNNLLLPINKLFYTEKDENDLRKVQQDYYVPYLLDQIKQLSQEIKALSTNLNDIKAVATVKENINKNSYSDKVKSDTKTIVKAKNLINGGEQSFTQNKNLSGNFKQAFMKDDKMLNNLDPKFAANFLEATKINTSRPTSSNSKMSYANGKFINSFQSKEGSLSGLNIKNISKAESNSSNIDVLALKDFNQVKEIVEIKEQIRSDSAESAINEQTKSNIPGLIKKLGDLFK